MALMTDYRWVEPDYRGYIGECFQNLRDIQNDDVTFLEEIRNRPLQLTAREQERLCLIYARLDTLLKKGI